MKTSILDNRETLEDLIKISENFCDLLKRVNLTPTSGNYTTLNKLLKKYNLVFKKGNKSKNKIVSLYSDEECFCEHSLIGRHHLKKKIINRNLIEYKCNVCGNTGEWQGAKLILQLEHKNGINNDNRLENLTFLCPNCHSQTDTYAGKNTGIV